MSSKHAGKNLDIAVIGAGLMGRWHAYTAKRLGARLIAVVDRDPEATKSLARQMGATRVFADLDSLLAVAQPMVIHICTPVDTHVDLGLRALRAGCHVLAEKPLATDFAAVQALHEAAAAGRRLLCPVHQFVFQDSVARVATGVRGLGDVLRIDFVTASAGGGTKRGAALDAIVADILPHPLSLLCRIWPDPPLSADGWCLSRSRPGEAVIYGNHGSIPVTIYVSMSARPTQCGMTVYCSAGTIHANLFHDYATFQSAKVSRLTKIGRPFKASGQTLWTASTNLLRRAARREFAYPGLLELTRQFYLAVREGSPAPIPATDSLAVAAARDTLSRDQSINTLV